MNWETRQKLKRIYAYFIIGLILTFIFLLGVIMGMLGEKIYGKKLLGKDNNYDFEAPKLIEEDFRENLSIHLCSTECYFEITLDDETKINDSFILNNKLNTSNCIKCDGYIRSV